MRSPRQAQVARRLGIAPTPASDYLTRIYGARAVALGVGYLGEPPDGRRRWHRLGLLVDVSDTLTAFGHLARHHQPPEGSACCALTGAYALVGAARLAEEQRISGSALARPTGSRPG